LCKIPFLFVGKSRLLAENDPKTKELKT